MKIDFPINTDEIGELDHHLVLDYLEILILAEEHNEISKADLDDILRDQGVYDKHAIQHLEWFRRDPRFSAAPDVNELYRDVIWECLERRILIMGDSTPFLLQKNALRLNKRRLNKCSDYLLLLLCTKLRMLEPGKRIELATAFEELCKRKLQKLFPKAEIKRFGKGGDFGSQLRQAIRDLGAWLNEPVRDTVIATLSDSGDFGLDIVGKLHADKRQSGTIFVVGQCAAREEKWHDKKFEAQKILATLDCFCTPVVTLFIPHAFRSADGSWMQEAHARQVALFDRVRLLT